MSNENNKIGIATVYTGYNYGSALQAFATKQILASMGLTADLLKLRGSLIAGRDIRVKKLLTIGFRSMIHAGGLKSLKNYQTSISKELSEETVSLFRGFTQEYLSPVELSYSELKRRAKGEEYQAFLCGSDQVWNASVFYVDPFYYLQFAPEHKRVAFAPSFGRAFVPDYNKKRIAGYLSGIPHKSVRETSGVKIVKDLTGDEAEVLVDPTLVLTAEDWREALDIRYEQDEKYLLAYFLDTPSEQAKKAVEEISRAYGLRVIGLPYQMEELPWEVYSAGPKEFVELISGAAFVCTDSFHGTAFSLNFNVPFYTFERNYGHAEKQSTRIESLLSMVKMEERFNPGKVGESDRNINFQNANEVLTQKREAAYRYLKHTVSIGVENHEK